MKARPVAGVTLPGVSVIFLSKRAGVESDVTTRLVRFVTAARTSLDCAIYDFRQVEVLAAMRAALRRGCRLRIAFDAGEYTSKKKGADPKPNETEQALDEFGLLDHARKIRRTSNAYLHNKFIVRDGAAIWTGTGNFTAGAFELQDNNFIVVRSRAVAERYAVAFDLIWAEPTRALKIPVAAFGRRIDVVGGAWIWPFFEPTDGGRIETAIAHALSLATKVRIAAFEISALEINTALKRFADPAADIRGIYDVNGMKGALARVKAPDPELYWWYMGDKRFAGVKSHPFNVLPGGLNDFHHNKTIILDDHTVITGSYNFSEHAKTNGEDILFIRSRPIAAAYRRYFRRMYAHYTASDGQ